MLTVASLGWVGDFGFWFTLLLGGLMFADYAVLVVSIWLYDWCGYEHGLLWLYDCGVGWVVLLPVVFGLVDLSVCVFVGGFVCWLQWVDDLRFWRV